MIMAFIDRIKSILSGKDGNTSGTDKPIADKVEEKPTLTTYISYYLFGHSIDRPLWHWEEWQHFLTPLQQIVDLSTEVPGIKSTQKAHGKGNLSFGNMKWSRENNQKWITKYVGEPGWEFYDTEIAYPSRSACAKSNLAPDILIIIENEALAGTGHRLIDQSITIHIRTALLAPDREPEIDKAVHEIGIAMYQKLMGKIKRPIAFPSEFGMGYTDSIWEGPRGVFDRQKGDFSDRFRKHGISHLA